MKKNREGTSSAQLKRSWRSDADSITKRVLFAEYWRRDLKALVRVDESPNPTGWVTELQLLIETVVIERLEPGGISHSLA